MKCLPSTFPALNGEILGVSTRSALTLDTTLDRPSLLSEPVSPSAEKTEENSVSSWTQRTQKHEEVLRRGLWAATRCTAPAELPREVWAGQSGPVQLPAPLPKGHA